MNFSTCCFCLSRQCPTETGVFHYDEDCTSYIVCHEGIPEYRMCPEGSYFNIDAMSCYPGRRCEPDEIHYINQYKVMPLEDVATSHILRSIWSVLKKNSVKCDKV